MTTRSLVACYLLGEVHIFLMMKKALPFLFLSVGEILFVLHVEAIVHSCLLLSVHIPCQGAGLHVFAFVRVVVVVVVVDICILVFIQGVFIFTGVLISVFIVSTGTLAVVMGPPEEGGWVVT